MLTFLGAMENWGLVTYREVCLLLDPEKTSSRVKCIIALIVGHELAHMWFGNLTTMVCCLSLLVTLTHKTHAVVDCRNGGLICG